MKITRLTPIVPGEMQPFVFIDGRVRSGFITGGPTEGRGFPQWAKPIDLRHEAVSRLFELGLGPMEVAAISGHKTLAMLKRYTHLRAEDLALKLS